MGSLALASFLQAKGHTVRIFDHQAQRGLMKAVREFRPDAAASTITTESVIPDALEMSRALKALGLPVLWGGHMASAIPELAARCGYVDYVGVSEGEYTLLELLEVIGGKRAPETVLGIAYVDEHGEYHRTADRPFADLADFPPLDFTLIPVKKYFSRVPFANRLFMIITSKGCVFSCTFCFNNEFHRCQRRMYPMEIIFRQIKTLAEDYGVNGFLFSDDLFGADKRYLREFCRGIKDLGLGLHWFVQTAIGILSREDMALMYEAGCRLVAFGLESGSAEMRKSLHKFYDASKIDETFRNCREAGLLTMANFIVGLPDETPEQVRETVRLFFRVNPDTVGLNYYTPIPGTQLSRALEASGELSPPKSLEEYKSQSKGWHRLPQNYSRVPAKDLQVILRFIHWQMVFGKNNRNAETKRGFVKMAISNLVDYLRGGGLRGLVRGLWESASYFCNVAWYAHAYPSIRKKYDLHARNFGRTHWDDA